MSSNICTFFLSPSGCDMGATCRDMHSSGGGGVALQSQQPSNFNRRGVLRPQQQGDEETSHLNPLNSQRKKKNKRNGGETLLTPNMQLQIPTSQAQGQSSSSSIPTETEKKTEIGGAGGQKKAFTLVKKVKNLPVVESSTIIMEKLTISHPNNPNPINTTPNGLSAAAKIFIPSKPSSSTQTSIPKDSSAASSTGKATQRVFTPARPTFSKPKSMQEEKLELASTSLEERASILRQIQVDPVLRRYPESTFDKGTSVISNISLIPSDPDFPFDLGGRKGSLDMALHLHSFPSFRDNIKLVIIGNEDIPQPLRKRIQDEFAKKFQVELDFSLLDGLKWLDKNLESLLINPAAGSRARPSSSKPMKNITFVAPTTREKQGAIGKEGVDEDLAKRLYFYGPRHSTDDEDEDFEEEGGREDNESDESSDDVEFDDGEGEEDDVDENNPFSQIPDTTTLSKARGTSIRLLNLHLVNISLLSSPKLSVVVKCERCKATCDILNIPANDASDSLPWTSKECAKCFTTMAVNFRPDLIHLGQSLSQLGFMDVEGCILYDLLPSIYRATCSSCETQQPINASFETISGPALICRGCHQRLEFTASQPKFVQFLPARTTSTHKSTITSKKIRSQKDGIVVGSPLPKNGACSHYKRSHRWFRFPCCGKLFPCDQCHEVSTKGEHAMEWASRVVCGFCSREQPFSGAQRACVCGGDMVSKAGKSGFWEGGKGTRDTTKMSRNDPRKKAGLAKTVSRRAIEKKYGKKAEKL